MSSSIHAFQPRATRRPDEPRPPGPATIIIFPGVRYERTAGAPTSVAKETTSLTPSAR